MNKINISFSTDNNYQSLYVAMYSILYNKHKNTAINFIILTTNDFKDEYKNQILILIRNFDNVSIDFISVEDKFFGVTSEIPHITAATYYRLLLPNIIDDDKCLYLDTDVIVCQDLYELYNTDIDGYNLAGVEAYFRKLSKINSFEKFLHEFEICNMEQYVNCGVLLMNLALLRKNNFYECGLKMFHRCHENDIRICGDQDIINAVCLNRIKILKPKYNVMPKYYKFPYRVFKQFSSKNDWEEAWHKPVIIHYVGEEKPWKLLSLPFSDNWWAYCYGSGMYSFFKKEILQPNVPEKIMFKYIFQNKLPVIDRIRYAENRIMIYGAGGRAKALYNKISNSDIDVKCFVVKKALDNPNEIEGHPVYMIENVPYKELPIIISLNNELHVEIIHDLWRKGIYNIIYEKNDLMWSEYFF